MHYSTLIITDKKPTADDIARILKPFDERPFRDKVLELENKYGEDEAYKLIEYPLLTWDWYQIGGRWDKSFKTKSGLGQNIVQIDDLTNLGEITAHNCIDDVTGEVIVRNFWNGVDFVTDNNYDSKLETIKERSKGKGYYMVMVDIHD